VVDRRIQIKLVLVRLGMQNLTLPLTGRIIFRFFWYKDDVRLCVGDDDERYANALMKYTLELFVFEDFL